MLTLLAVLAGAGTSLDAQVSTSPTPTAETVAKLDPLLQKQLADPSGQSYVVVRAVDAASVAVVAGLIQQLGGTLGRELAILTAQAAQLPNASVLTLAESPAVQRVALDRLMLGFVERTAATVGANAVREWLGYDGSGIGVAVIDSGVTPWHNDLADVNVPGTQRVDRFVDFVGGQSTPYDDYGHGTHVAGIIAGNGADSGGFRAGMAPAARLVVLKVLDGAGRGRISDVIAAIDYAVSHKDELNIRVINMSVGAGVYESFNTDLLTQAAKRAVEAGIVVVAAAGNHGRDASGVIQYGAINAPANAPWVIAVGASSHMGTITRADDTIALFSSRGPTAIDHAAKPDLVAPGVGIYSLSSLDSTLYQSKTQYLLSGVAQQTYMPYLSLSGTSQASPVVAGTVALMLQANPLLTPNAVKAILQYTTEPYAGYSALAQGAGFLNARGAVDLALRFSAPPEARGPNPVEWSGQITWGNHRVGGGHLTSTANAWNASVTWGAPASGEQQVTWGVVCTGTDCETNGAAWSSWGASCTDVSCDTIVWGSEHSVNVVWGATCGGSDCKGTVWATTDDDTVVWGNTAEAETVVWGNTESDTVVWGNTEAGADTVVWGNSGADAACEPVIWPE